MTSVLVIRRQSNLSKLVNASGGKTVQAALRDADRGMAGLRDEGLAILDEALMALEGAVAAATDGPDWLDRVYSAAGAVIDVCPPDLMSLHSAAWSLCELCDLQRRAGRCETRSILVHLSSLKLLRQPGQPEAVLTGTLAGLATLLAHETSRPG
jgi:hypothetical protein